MHHRLRLCRSARTKRDELKKLDAGLPEPIFLPEQQKTVDAYIKQLSDLQDDVKKHLYDEETTSKYIQDEEAELRIMEAQIKYFQEKFDEQKEVVKQLRKE